MSTIIIKLTDVIGDQITQNMMVLRYRAIYKYHDLPELIRYMQSSIEYSAPEQTDKINAHKLLIDALKKLPKCDTFTIE